MAGGEERQRGLLQTAEVAGHQGRVVARAGAVGASDKDR
jgi:hypothetical protein